MLPKPIAALFRENRNARCTGRLLLVRAVAPNDPLEERNQLYGVERLRQELAKPPVQEFLPGA